MNKEENIENRIQATLNSLEGMQRATPGDFFFTRVNARLANNKRSVWEMLSGLIARPAIAFTGLCLVILINTLAVYRQAATIASANESTELALVDEYSVGATSFYNYENTDLK